MEGVRCRKNLTQVGGGGAPSWSVWGRAHRDLSVYTKISMGGHRKTLIKPIGRGWGIVKIKIAGWPNFINKTKLTKNF